MTVPPEAITAAYGIAKDALSDGHYAQAAGRELMGRALGAAAPLIAAAERERIRQLPLLRAISDPGSILARLPDESLSFWQLRAVLDRIGDVAADRQAEVRERAGEIHAEHHPGYIVPSLDSCPVHTRAEYEALAAGLLKETPS